MAVSLQRLLASLMNRVRVNEVRPAMQDGDRVFVKRRRRCGSFVIWCGNRFLQLAGSGVCMFVRPSEWIAWELYCAQLLYPERTGVRIGPGQSLVVPDMGGSSLRQLLVRRESIDAAFQAAGRELRRVHQLPCSHYQAGWSHGDLHLDNILYNADLDRVFLIDFDTRHLVSRNAVQRHGDDLLLILLELIATAEDGWVQPATALLEEYREPSVLCELGRQLVVPNGLGRVLWFTRTNNCPLQRIQPRLQLLREIVGNVASTAGDENRAGSSQEAFSENHLEYRSARNWT